MRAAVVNGFGAGFDVEEIDIEEPRGREVLVDIKASGLCHSDLHFAETNFGMEPPMVLGHEIAGVVAGIGPEVTEFSVGDHVVGSLVQFCGACVACLSGDTVRCAHPEATLRAPDEPPRLSRRGEPVLAAMGTAGFAEQALLHENQLVGIDPAVPFAEASVLGCGTITGAGAAINSAGVRPGQTVAVIGLGGVGLNVISGARLAGAARIIGIDLNDEKLELARAFGATDVVNGRDGDVVAAVQQLTDGGVDHAFEVIGRKDTALQAIAMLAVGGTASLIGIHGAGSTIELDPNDFLRWQKKVQGVYMGHANIKRDIPFYASLFLQGRLNLTDLISVEIGIDDLNEAYDQLRTGRTARSVITRF
ncbi:Zn-dependent alcohol dehydrogenase [Microbacterium sp.]|jgi:S-(hydroxymethyl)glutathione dehydrogenase/alcohol dehydrogenase|uniref:Zn-dependent alcohol dehydrogenase n=1 Tax=Microbacterium sp. TaxID=51671 RepID=UPI00271DDCD2|nr:Zn-dependent alcohol dehydrogenase [Microbacterium sp.]MDO8382951.1 Zn-dependent alcohol dehydrogenase [Microbacterium sp.]